METVSWKVVTLGKDLMVIMDKQSQYDAEAKSFNVDLRFINTRIGIRSRKVRLAMYMALRREY